jgi:hypothetical protein
VFAGIPPLVLGNAPLPTVWFFPRAGGKVCEGTFAGKPAVVEVQAVPVLVIQEWRLPARTGLESRRLVFASTAGRVRNPIDPGGVRGTMGGRVVPVHRITVERVSVVIHALGMPEHAFLAVCIGAALVVFPGVGHEALLTIDEDVLPVRGLVVRVTWRVIFLESPKEREIALFQEMREILCPVVLFASKGLVLQETRRDVGLGGSLAIGYQPIEGFG